MKWVRQRKTNTEWSLKRKKVRKLTGPGNFFHVTQFRSCRAGIHPSCRLATEFILETRVSRPWPEGQISFCMTPMLRMILHFLMIGGKKSKECFLTHENYMKFKFKCPEIKFSWVTATAIHLCVIYGCFPAITAELNSCDRNSTAPRA